jgi:hypothetical protein
MLTTWLARGAVVIGVAWTSAHALAACSSAGENAGNPAGGDGGTTDAGPDGSDGGVPPRHARLVAVHASPDLPDVRLCIAVDGHYATNQRPVPDDSNGPMPKSNYPGLAAGGAFRLPDLGTLANKTVTITAIKAKRISDGQARTDSCDNLLCSGGGSCLDPTDYFRLPDLESTFTANNTYLLVLDGCVSAALDPNGSPARCGSDYTSGGNLKALPVETADGYLDVGPGAFPLQVAMLSHGLDGLQVSAAADSTSLATTHAFADVSPLTPQTIAFPSSIDGWGQKVFDVQAAELDAGIAPLVASYAAVQYATDPTQVPDQYFRTRGNFVLAIVGDPSSASQQQTLADGGANDTYDGHGLHLLVFPTSTGDTP